MRRLFRYNASASSFSSMCCYMHFNATGPHSQGVRQP
jgi:hypothetical protein